MDESKKDLILRYLTQQIALLPSLSKQYTSGKPTRISFLQLKSITDSFFKKQIGERIVLMPGLRGVGKTTLLFQTYEHIRENHENAEIIYLSLDVVAKQLNSSLQECLEVYETKILNSALENLDKKVVLLVDEAHYDESWSSVVKSIYDRTKEVLVLISGSSSIAIEIDTDLTRRMYIERIYPLNFPEYLLIKRGVYPRKNLGNEIKEALFKSENIETAFEKLQQVNQRVIKEISTKIPNLDVEIMNFISKGGFPAMLEETKEEKVFRKILSVLDRIVYQDILTFYPSSKPNIDKVISILTVIANSSDRVSYSKLMEIQNVKSKSAMVEIMLALKKAGVIIDLKVEGSPAKMGRNSPKYYFASPTIRAALLWSIGTFQKNSGTIGYLLENAVFNTLYKLKTYSPDIIQHIAHDSEAGNPDFKVTTSLGKMLIECGWGRKSSRQMKSKDDKRFGIIISDVREPKLNKETNSIYIPREIMLLMG